MEEQIPEESLEFQEMNDTSQLTEILRSCFRIPVSEKKDCYAVINGCQYFLSDISVMGIGLISASAHSFSSGEVLGACDLTIMGKTIEKLKGEIVHLTPQSEGRYIYGVKWIDLDETVEKLLGKIVQNLKKDFLL
ncbi:MAG: PilZ domain-containing protein [Desulfobacteraceae bacterium]